MTIKFKPEARNRFIREWNTRVYEPYRLDGNHNAELCLNEEHMRKVGKCMIHIEYEAYIGHDKDDRDFIVSHEDVILDPPYDPNDKKYTEVEKPYWYDKYEKRNNK